MRSTTFYLANWHGAVFLCVSHTEFSQTPKHNTHTMAEQIQNSEVNPIVILVCQWFGIGFLGYWLMGQKKKAIGAVVYIIGLYLIFWIGLIFWILAIVDGFLVAKKLQAGESIEDDHCEIAFLQKLPLWHN
uniref:Uncharacterized protein n=1 Tax=Percolomonas cosmopolitus TaxID=63605 RepID=A0A7S1KP95_9EUKA|mmetsp:Transcript_1386/g.4773  ORF Transcript_1386/g.4773 Transcript_1386/m.4773 type:complete len:131 (+) Transcript_1386:133-525(+)